MLATKAEAGIIGEQGWSPLAEEREQLMPAGTSVERSWGWEKRRDMHACGLSRPAQQPSNDPHNRPHHPHVCNKNERWTHRFDRLTPSAGLIVLRERPAQLMRSRSPATRRGSLQRQKRGGTAAEHRGEEWIAQQCGGQIIEDQPPTPKPSASRLTSTTITLPSE
jgi:hypothetical protein